MKRVTIVVALLFCVLSGKAQFVTNTDFSEELFLYKVKTIDEFIDRFNDDLSSFLRHEYFKQNKPFTLSRYQLIVSLLNKENTAWSTDTALKGFLDNVVSQEHPQFLFFNSPDWYAEAACWFSAGGKKVCIPVVLHIQTETNKGTKWMITGLGKSPVLKDTGHISLKYKSDFFPNTKYISSPSHATSFVELANVFLPDMNARYYFDTTVLNNGHVKKFVNLILENKLKFLYVSDVKYHFCQIPGCILDVAYYNRANYNSGWLINKIRYVSDEQKNKLIREFQNL